jgi:3-phosphoshikimate 1-carboxyvinyltransferase
MTRLVLEQSGIRIRRRNARRYDIPGGQVFRGLKTFSVPADYGLAAFMIAAGLLTDSPLVFKGHFNLTWVQADGRIIDFLRRMGVAVKIGPGTLRWSRRGPLKGGDFSLKDCPDLVPVMAVLALFAKGRTRLTDIRHARVKESNRITDLRLELEKVGARVRETADAMMIEPRPEYKGGVCLDPRHDHRLAMAFTALGLKLGLRVKDIECVSKSYPDFIRDLKALGARVKRV